MKESAKEMETMSRREREKLGNVGEGPGVIARTDLAKSVDIMIRNSQLNQIVSHALPDQWLIMISLEIEQTNFQAGYLPCLPLVMF